MLPKNPNLELEFSLNNFIARPISAKFYSLLAAALDSSAASFFSAKDYVNILLTKIKPQTKLPLSFHLKIALAAFQLLAQI